MKKEEFELVGLVSSLHHNCLYCIVAHSALFRVFAKDKKLADQVKLFIEYPCVTHMHAFLLMRFLFDSVVRLTYAQSKDHVMRILSVTLYAAQPSETVVCLRAHDSCSTTASTDSSRMYGGC